MGWASTRRSVAFNNRIKRWARRLAPWGDMVRSFQVEGFYDRCPAKGQVERVARIHRELSRWAGLQVRGRG